MIISIKSESQITKKDIEDYFTEEVWRGFLHRFLEVVDEDATFEEDFGSVWKGFMDECLRRMLSEIIGHKKLIEIKDLNGLTAGYNIYDITNSLRLNDETFKDVVKKELGKFKSDNRNPAHDK